MNKLTNVGRMAHARELEKTPTALGSLERGGIGKPFGNVAIIGAIRVIVPILLVTGLASPVAAGPGYEAAKCGDAAATGRAGRVNFCSRITPIFISSNVLIVNEFYYSDCPIFSDIDEVA